MAAALKFTDLTLGYERHPAVHQTRVREISIDAPDIVCYADGERLAPLPVTIAVQPNALTTFQQLNSAILSGVPFAGRTVGEVIDFLKTKAGEALPDHELHLMSRISDAELNDGHWCEPAKNATS